MAQQNVTQRSTARTVIGGILIAIGVIMAVVGIVAWFAVGSQLKAQNMVVPGDAPSNAGKVVAGPFTAWSMQETIQMHADAGTDGLTYAELGQAVSEAQEEFGEDSEEAAAAQAMRTTQMNASFLRSSLFVSILASGVSLLAFGTGTMGILTGVGLMVRRPQVVVNADVLSETEVR